MQRIFDPYAGDNDAPKLNASRDTRPALSADSSPRIFDPYADDSAPDVAPSNSTPTPESAPVLRQPREPVDSDKDVRSGLLRGANQTQSLAGGFLEAAGEATGIDRLENYGRDVRESNEAEASRYQAQVGGFTDIRSIGDAADWLQGTIAETIPQMAPSIAGGAAGAALGSAIAPGAGTALGAAIGAFAPSFVLGVGEAQGEIKERGGDNAAAAFGIGALSGALDTVVPGKLGGKLVKSLGKEGAEAAVEEAAKREIRSILKDGAKDAFSEGLTEAVQDNLIQVGGALATDTDYDFDLKGTINSFAAGAAGGGVASSAISYLTRPGESTSTDDPTEQAASVDELAQPQSEQPLTNQAAPEVVEQLPVEPETVNPELATPEAQAANQPLPLRKLDLEPPPSPADEPVVAPTVPEPVQEQQVLPLDVPAEQAPAQAPTEASAQPSSIPAPTEQPTSESAPETAVDPLATREDDVIGKKSSYKSESAAKGQLKKRGLAETHAVVPVHDGFALRKKEFISEPTENTRAAEDAPKDVAPPDIKRNARRRAERKIREQETPQELQRRHDALKNIKWADPELERIASEKRRELRYAKAKDKKGFKVDAKTRAKLDAFPDPTQDDLATWIRKNGGLRVDKDEGRDFAGRLQHLGKGRSYVGTSFLPSIEQTGTDADGNPKGLTLPKLAERAREAGFIPESDIGNGVDDQDFHALLSQLETGQEIYSSIADPNRLQAIQDLELAEEAILINEAGFERLSGIDPHQIADFIEANPDWNAFLNNAETGSDQSDIFDERWDNDSRSANDFFTRVAEMGGDLDVLEQQLSFYESEGLTSNEVMEALYSAVGESDASQFHPANTPTDIPSSTPEISQAGQNISGTERDQLRPGHPEGQGLVQTQRSRQRGNTERSSQRSPSQVTVTNKQLQEKYSDDEKLDPKDLVNFSKPQKKGFHEKILSEEISTIRQVLSDDGMGDTALTKVKAGELSLPQGAIENLEKAFRKRIVAVDGAQGVFDGAFTALNPDVIYVSTEASQPEMRIVGHELTHSMRNEAPELYDALANQLYPLLRGDGKSRYRSMLSDQYGDDRWITEDVLMEEMVADVVGDQFVNSDFWASLASNNPGTFESVAKYIKKFFQKLLRSLRGLNTSDKFVSDIEKAEKVVSDVMQQYIDSKRGDTKAAQALDVQAAKFKELWHGSKANFDKFNLDYATTGEGNNAYGYGTYLAESKDVAEFYRRTVSAGTASFVDNDGKPIEPTTDEEIILDTLAYDGVTDVKKFITDRQKEAAKYHGQANSGNKDAAKFAKDIINVIKQDVAMAQDLIDRGITIKKERGTTYRVKANFNDQQIVDWDKPLNKQDPAVQEKLKPAVIRIKNSSKGRAWRDKLDSKEVDGSMIYNLLSQAFGENDSAASRFLLEHGIRAMRYKDAVSRNGSKKGTSNYVSFDDTDLQIDAKFSKAQKANRKGVRDLKATIHNYIAKSMSDFREKHKDVPTDWVRTFQDRYVDLGDQTKKTEKKIGRKLDDAANPFAKLDLYDSLTTRKLEKFTKEHSDKILDKVAESGVERSELGEWLMARHAEEANARLQRINKDAPSSLKDKLSGMDNATADEIKNRHKDNKALQEAGELIDAMNRRKLEFMVEQGLTTQGEADKLNKAYNHWIPLRKDEFDNLIPSSVGRQVKGREFQYRTGYSDWADQDILAQTLITAKTAIVRASTNKIYESVAKLAEQHPDKDFFEVKEVVKGRRLIEPNAEAVRKKIEEENASRKAAGQGDLLGEKEAVKLLTKEEEIDMYSGEVKEVTVTPQDKHIITFKRGGKEFHIVFNKKNPRAVNAAVSLKLQNMSKMNKALEVMAVFSRYMSTLNTTWSPEFMVTNFSRDFQTAIYNLAGTEAESNKHMRAIAANAPKAMNGIRQSLFSKEPSGEWVDAYKKFENAGAKTGWIDLTKDINAYGKEIEKAVNRRAAGKPDRNVFMRIVKNVENANTIFENSMRLYCKL